MGFSTSAMYCLMSHTPVIRCADLARFLHEFHNLGILKADSPYPCNIKFGRKPDKNDRELLEQLPVPGVRGMFKFRMQPCEIDLDRDQTFDDVITLLEQTAKKPVYRASIYLGSVKPEFHDRVYAPSDKNDRTVSMDSWMLHIGPQIVSDSNSDTGDQFHLGYLSVSLGGQGYCMPRTQREVMDCIRAQPETQAVEKLCQSIWPADPYEAHAHTVAMRKAMGILWPYDELDRPVGWDWVIMESF